MGIVIKKIKNGTIEFAPTLEPVSYMVKKSDIYSDSTGRSAETGVLIAYLIRKDVYTISLEFCGNDSEISQIERAINNNILEVTFWDSGSYVTKTMYPSDREKTLHSITRNLNGRYTLSFNLIEY